VCAHKIDGKATAQSVKDLLKRQISNLRSDGYRAPGLAVILVGDDPASHYYVASKEKACAEIGVRSFKTLLPVNTTKDELLAVIYAYNQDDNVDGILLQLPLPKELKPYTKEIVDSISINKDADGLTSTNMGRLLNANPNAIYPCTPKGCMHLLRAHNIDLVGKKALVIGRSELVGKPLAIMLSQANATVTMAHSMTLHLDKELAQADIVLVAIGRKEFVKGEWIKPGAVVIDVGINTEESPEGKKKLYGDVEYSSASKKASFITPVPGGVGPMTVAMLLDNTVELYKRHI
jgi:methylenetetrahydrofolate dehydrogenase (NADP+)/methenyltetrahydrofolate cyclohydrolase